MIDEAPMRDLETAMHEAGHAVMALDVKARLFRTWINPDHTGGTRYSVGFPMLDLQISLAGFIAQSWIGELDLRGLGSDERAITALVHEIWGEGLEDGTEECAKALNEKLQISQNIARETMGRLRPSVDKLAAELCIRRSMTGDEVKALL